MSYLPSIKHVKRVLKILTDSLPFIIHFIVTKIIKGLPLRVIITLIVDSPRFRVADLRHPRKTPSYDLEFNANHDL